MAKYNIGIITTDSFKQTMHKGIEDGDYNQARAHLYNVMMIAKSLGEYTIYDIGEAKSKKTKVYDDITLHEESLGMHVNEVTLKDYVTHKGIRLIFYLYNYLDTKEKRSYFVRSFLFADQVVYYASDDEVYYPDYALHLIANRKLKVQTSKIKLILSGHSYAKYYGSIGPKCLHYPMIPDVNAEIPIPTLCTPQYDFFLNAFHHSDVVKDYATKLSNRSILVATNDVIGPYIKAMKLPNIAVKEFRGRNIPLQDLISMAVDCKYYLIPNTYYHTDEWYHHRYPQSIMYTHKVIEAFYANRVCIGDLSDQELKLLNKKDIPFLSRKKYYSQYGKDPVQIAIKNNPNIINNIISIIKQ